MPRIAAAMLATLVALVFGASAHASLGRVVAIGDSMAPETGLGPTLPMLNPACGRTSGSYPQLVAARLTASAFEDVTCNGGHTGVFDSTNPGLDIPENNHVTIPPQFNSLNGSEQAVIVGTGGNEAYFGEMAFACLGYLPDLDIYARRLGGKNAAYANNCATTYGADGSGLLAKVYNAESLVGPALDKTHQHSPNAKIFLVGIPRMITPDGAGCMPNPIVTPTDAPLVALWEDQLRLAMKRVVAARSSWATFVDVQQVSGTTHTMCAAWGQKWINPWSVEPGLSYPGIELHNTPAGAGAMAGSIVDAFHEAGLDTGTQAKNPTNPVVTITAPANNSLTRNAATLLFTASDNVAVADCSRASGSSVPLSEGANTIVVDYQDRAGNHGSAQVNITRDSTPPAITNITPASGTNTTASSIALTYSASDNLGTPACSPSSGTVVNPSTGANTIAINRTDAAGNPASASVVVNRGSKPVVAISSPADGLSTTSPSVNVAFTVGGGASIPAGASCTVNGTPTSSPSTNSVSLMPGANTITVVCANRFGAGAPASVKVTGSPPSEVAITAPAEGANTAAATINVAYSISGSSSFPLGTSCTVNGAPSSDTATNPVALSLGSNTITVVCSGAFGAKSASVHVNRGNPPSVAISAPASGTGTAAGTINVAYTVGGAAAIPAGTACTVNGASSTSATTNSAALSVGTNTITVICVNQVGQSTPASVTVTRGKPPIVAITAPADGANTTAGSVNVAYTVDGSGSIPAGTSCSVGGNASIGTATNSVALAPGSNTIAVSCSNAFGASAPVSVTVNRGSVPSVAIAAPTDGTNTAAGSVNVAYKVDGSGAIPNGTSCTVNGAASASAASNPVDLAVGSNTITVRCGNVFGTSSPASISVKRGYVPAVAIVAPAGGTNTTASSINLAYTVDGDGSIPAGTSCKVNGQASASAGSNPVPLQLGVNTLTVECGNAFGPSAPATVTVNRGNPPAVAVVAPADGSATSSPSTNVAFTVDGVAAIPTGTTCRVGAKATSDAVTNSVALTLGVNALTVTCTNAFGSGSQSISVTRGNGPAVDITAPANGLKTVYATVNVSFTVDGSSTIPVGTTCSVGGQATASATANSRPLVPGLNVIAVTCKNALGEDSESVAVERGDAPSVTIASPADGLNTIEKSVAVSFGVSGSGAPNCDVNGNAADSPVSVALNAGANTITVVCRSAFGADSKTLTVNRGSLPVVYINAALRTDTIARVVNATYSVDGGEMSPPGTTCTVNDAPSTSTQQNPVELTPGENTVIVRCANTFGESSTRVFVTYTPRAEPPSDDDPPATSKSEPATPAAPAAKRLSLTVKGRATLKPARRGEMFLKAGARGGLALKIKLDVAASVNVRIERLGAGKSKKIEVAGNSTLDLPAGTSKLRLSGRIGKRALRAGVYRVRVTVPGTKLRAVSGRFRVKR